MGRTAADRISGQGRGPAVLSGAGLSDQYGELFRDCWWPAVAVLTRLTGDLETAEDAVQDACALALTKWPAEGVPSRPRGWLVGVARHKALDLMRREARRAPLEAAAARDRPGPQDDGSGEEEPGDEELALIFMCCHPALDPGHGGDRRRLRRPGADDGAAPGPGQAQDPPGRNTAEIAGS
jgi:hypothetical protein